MLGKHPKEEDINKSKCKRAIFLCRKKYPDIEERAPTGGSRWFFVHVAPRTNTTTSTTMLLWSKCSWHLLLAARKRTQRCDRTHLNTRKCSDCVVVIVLSSSCPATGCQWIARQNEEAGYEKEIRSKLPYLCRQFPRTCWTYEKRSWAKGRTMKSCLCGRHRMAWFNITNKIGFLRVYSKQQNKTLSNAGIVTFYLPLQR